MNEIVTRPMCGNCVHCGERWSDFEQKCGKIEERKQDFANHARSVGMEALDAFRFSPTTGVLPHSSAERCKYYESVTTK